QLPIGFLPLLLREVIAYDWKFPIERKDLDRQLAYLDSLSPEQRRQLMSAFAQLRLPAELERVDWINLPGEFSEKFTAHLWATHQIDAFRAAAIDYVNRLNAASPQEPLPAPRLGIAVIGSGVAENRHPLFRKLRPHGVYFTRVKPDNGIGILVKGVAARAAAHPSAYGHWYVDGGSAETVPGVGVTSISYGSLTPVRTALLNKMRTAYESAGFNPEALRTMLAELRPEDLGLGGTTEDAVLNHFQISLLTEGSGTQVFSTTFVQWSAREVWRRAQPLTMLLRFAPRQRQRPMNELLAEGRRAPELDPQGSLVDADMGAYYTWLNQQRLSGADQARFLVWFEGHNEALAIAPSLPRGIEDHAQADLADLLKRIA
ncbi:MAG: hypothetical protein ACRD4P_10880, partial [Bryobacteraceae bacterium]